MNQHLTEEQLVLHFYNEESAVAAAHLAHCADCRAGYQSLQRILNSVDHPVPERGSDYERHVWSQLAPKLGLRRPWFYRLRQQLAASAAMLALALVAFLAGRYSWQPQAGSQPIAQGQVRERLLIVAVSEHLDRSQMILAELANAESGSELDITDERMRAENLLDANRLYRQTATAAGEPGMASVLDELERVLLEVTHSSSLLSASEVEQIRQRIESQGLLFKLRVVGSQLRERGTKPTLPGRNKQI